MDFQSIIASRRDGRRHTQEEIVALAQAAGNGSVPDYQLTAWLMAAFLHPLSEEETAWLTVAMADSGERIDLTGLPKPWVDKHSTGGVGDKTTLVLLPLLAACGLTVVKMSGRGLGITGGTVDKLGSVPGFRLDLTPQEMKDQAAQIGLAITGQTPNLAPADKTLYSLRDATTTVASLPLIVSSILSKKIAGGAETVVLDVKCGRGGFMPTQAAAHELAHALVTIGTKAGLNVRAAITDMDQPLGEGIGNALEVREAMAVLSGEVPSERFVELIVQLAGLTLFASGKASSQEAGESAARAALNDGTAKEKARQWFLAQGATVDVFETPDAMPVAPVILEVRASESGWIEDIDPGIVGLAVVHLGGGRQKKDDVIDLAVGVRNFGWVGKHVAKGDLLAEVHAANEAQAAAAVESVTNAIKISRIPAVERPVVLAG